MATTLEPRSETQPYVEADEYIDFQLSKTQSQIKTTEILTSSIWLGLSVLLYLLTFVILDQWVIPGGFGVWARAAWLVILVVFGGGWGVWRILMPSFRSIHEMYAAKMIESSDPTLKSSLLNLVDLQVNNRKTQSALVRSSMEKRAAVELARVDVDHAINQRELQRLAYTLLAAIVICSLYVMLSPKDAFSSLERFILPMSSTAVATRTTITNVTPGDTKVLAGEILTVEADILGQDPRQVNLVYTTNDKEFVNQPVEMVRAEAGLSRFRGIISGEKGRGLLQGLTYHIEAGDARTHDYQITVVEPPSSKVVDVHYEFPKYMRLDPKTHPGGHIDGWEGTKVTVTAETNIPVESALLVLTDTENPQAKGEEIRMTITKGKQLSAEWTLGFRSDGTFARYYHIDCKTAVGESDPLPIVYAVKIQPDQRPDVALLHPTQDLERPANAVVPLLVKAMDPDFQLRFVTLRVERAGEEIHTAALLDEERPSFEGTHDLKLEPLGAGGGGLQPGEEVIYWIEARDNKQPHGNRSVTPRLKIKITAPAKPDEVAKQLEQDRERQQKELEQANPDPNQQGEEQKPEEKKPEDAHQNKPKPPNADRQPSEPKPPEERKRPEQGEKEEPEQPNQDQKPEDQNAQGEKKQQGKSSNQNQAGKQGAKSEQKRGQQGAEGDKQNSGKPDKEAGSKDADSGEESPDGKGADSKQRKKGPADDQRALREFIKRQQEEASKDDAQANSEDKQNDEGKEGAKEDQQQGTEGAGKSGQQPKAKQQKQDKPEKTGENSADGGSDDASDMTQKDDKQKTGQKSAQEKTQSGDQTSENKTDDPQNKSNKNATQKNRDDQKGPEQKKADTNSGKNQGAQRTEKQPAGEKNSQMKNKPVETADNADKSDETGKTDKGDKAKQNKAGAKPGDKEQGKPQGKAGQQPNGAGQEKTDDPATGDKKENQNSENTGEEGTEGSKPGSKTARKDDKQPMPAPMKDPGGAAGAADDKKDDNQDASRNEGGGEKPAGPMKMNGTKKEPGAGNGQKPDEQASDKNEKTGNKNSSDNEEGEESPTDDGKGAVKKKATGDETGEAEGQEKPEGDKAPQAKGDLKEKPESKQGQMRKSDEPPQPGAKTERGSKDPDQTKAKPDGSERMDKQEPGTNKSSKQPPEKRPGTDPSENEPNPGKGRKDQKSQQADTGEGGGGTPQDQGTPGSKEKGTGDTRPEPGNQTPDKNKQGGKPSDKSGEGSQSKPSKAGSQSKPGEKGDQGGDQQAQQQQGGEGGKPGGDPKAGEGQAGKDAGKPGDAKGGSNKGGQPGQGGGQPGQGAPGQNQPGSPQNNGNGEPRGERRNLNPAEQTQADEEAAEKANEEFARKASSLVLKKLRKDLDRGEVDQKLLDELGWTKDDLERFVQRLENQLHDSGEDNSPEAEARRRQFEETLKTLGLNAKVKKRAATSTRKTQAGQLEIRKSTPPPEYRELYESFTKELAKPK